MQGCTIKILGIVKNELPKNMKQASIKYFLCKNFKRNMIDDKQSNIHEVFLFFLLSFFL